jgi:prephenate dehydrogenase
MDESEFAKLRIVIIGLGLIGSSIAINLKKHRSHITGIDHNVKTLAFASNHEYVDEATTSLDEGIRGADVIILAVPVRTILSILKGFSDSAKMTTKQDCLVMDVGSTKAQIVQYMEELPSNLQPVGGHPMCGRETSGIEAADRALFNDAFFMLTPLKRTKLEAVALAEYIVKLLGARPYLINAARHDRIVATASHLPYSLACLLMRNAMKFADEDKLVWEAVSSGFRDTSRLAASEVTMMLDILMSNRTAISDELSTFEEYLHEFRNAIATQDERWLREFLSQVKQQRNQLFIK